MGVEPRTFAGGGSCPGCGRYAGPVLACPYCGAGLRRDPAFRILRALCLCLATLGLLFLYAFARAAEPREARIGEISPTMNFARICIRGTLERTPYVRRQGRTAEYVSMLLDDGTGRLRVSAAGRPARELDAAGKIPPRGARLRVTGTLRLSRDEARLYVDSADAVVPEPEGSAQE